MCGGHISVRTKAVGNRHKAKLLGSYNTGDTSKMDRFLYIGMKEDQIRFLLLVKKYQPNSIYHEMSNTGEKKKKRFGNIGVWS